MRHLLLFVVIGCAPEGDHSVDPDPTDAEPMLVGLDFVGECEAVASSSSLVATAGAGRIDIVHTGVDLGGCRHWDADVSYVGADEIEVRYVNRYRETGDPCTEACGWAFSYWLEVPPGTWTVYAAGDEATVTVE